MNVDPKLTLEERATNYETMLHIARVRDLLGLMMVELIARCELHDQSKLASPEVEHFTAKTAALSGTTYGSQQYDSNKAEIAPALQHHYANNRHHPEHFKSGIQDMNLIDLLEMFCDWKAASERHANGNLRKSIEINAVRFGMSPDLVRIFENSIELVE